MQNLARCYSLATKKFSKLLGQQNPDAPVIPANVDDSQDESDESDFRWFESGNVIVYSQSYSRTLGLLFIAGL